MQIVKSQCSVTKKVENHSTTYIANFEKIFENTEDVENGVMTYSLRVALNKDLDKSVLDTYLLECSFVSDRIYSPTPPRKIKIKFTDNDSILIEARTVEDLPNNTTGIIAQLYLYELVPEFINKLLNKSITLIDFIDHRKKKLIRSNPYKHILKEQITCLNVLSSK